ncbi:hypothetical protein JXA32_07805 [Candidatus Sumerlaeota bacterium]|nr:hypothetical protein [Candidatus Sumerlaeota bacterium]
MKTSSVMTPVLKLLAPTAVAVALFFLLLSGFNYPEDAMPIIAFVIFAVWLVFEFYFFQEFIGMCLRLNFSSLSRMSVRAKEYPMVAKNDGAGFVRIFPLTLFIWIIAALLGYLGQSFGFVIGFLILVAVSMGFSIMEMIFLPSCFRRGPELLRESRWVAAQHGMALFTLLGSAALAFTFVSLFF